MLRLATLAALAAACAACTGVIGESAGGDPPPPAPPARPPALPSSPPPSSADPPSACRAGRAGPPVLRRLTRAEYERTVADLLGLPRTAIELDDDGEVGGFASNALSRSSETAIVRYRAAAEALAGRAGRDLWRAARCAAGDAACAGRAIADLGRRAFRRPLAPHERAAYEALFGRTVAARGAEAAMAHVVATMLQSAFFLYHLEETGPVDPATRTAPLTSHALAARLSYFLWRTMPDAELARAADDGSLLAPATRAAQVRRLLASPRARETVTDFFGQWLGLRALATVGVDARKYPEWGEPLRRAMRRETDDFVGHVVFGGGDGRIRTLLAAASTIYNEGIGPLYGVSGTTGQPVALDPARRAGLLTQPSVLTVTHGPVLRGKMVLGRVLCREVPPPPPDLDTTLPPPRPNQSPRARLEAHAQQEACRACHSAIDPLGFAFDHFDEIGRWRDADGGFPIDARGEVAVDGAPHRFEGARSLLDRLAASDEVQACLARQWLRFALGRLEAEGDACLVEDALAGLRGSGGDLRALLAAIATSDGFARVGVP